MGKKTGKTESAKVDQVYVLGLDANGKPRGARFAELKDSIVSAAMDMKCRVLIDQPAAVSALGMKLPVGRVYGGGKVVKLFVPNIRRELYDKYWPSRRSMISALQTIRMASTTLACSSSRARPSCSRSTTTMRTWNSVRPTRLIPPLPTE